MQTQHMTGVQPILEMLAHQDADNEREWAIRGIAERSLDPDQNETLFTAVKLLANAFEPERADEPEWQWLTPTASAICDLACELSTAKFEAENNDSIPPIRQGHAAAITYRRIVALDTALERLTEALEQIKSAARLGAV